MRALMLLALSVSIGSLSSAAAAADKAFTGVFKGTGRACFGALYVRGKTIEWNSSFSVCKPTRYEILEKNLDSGHERIVFRLKTRSRRCRYSVIEVERENGYYWSVSGYPSLEGFQKKDLPDWSNSPLPEREIFLCSMSGPD